MKTSQKTACKRIRKLGIYPQNFHCFSIVRSGGEFIEDDFRCSACGIAMQRSSMTALGKSAVDRHTCSCLDNSFEGSSAGCFGATGGNKNDIVRLKIHVGRFCRE